MRQLLTKAHDIDKSAVAVLVCEHPVYLIFMSLISVHILNYASSRLEEGIDRNATAFSCYPQPLTN